MSQISTAFIPTRLDWQPDVPDFRDYGLEHPEIRPQLRRTKTKPVQDPPACVDLREFFCWPVPTAGDRTTSAAIACLGLHSFIEYKSRGSNVPRCPRYLSQVTRRSSSATHHAIGLRDTLKSMKRCGVPPRRWTMEQSDDVDLTRDPLLYTCATEFASMRYARVGSRDGSDGGQMLDEIRNVVAAGFAVAIGFGVPSSLMSDGLIDYRPTFDAVQGGVAAIVTGYDDLKLGASRGALLVRCPWGPEWGESGYGWLPYSLVSAGMARDCWLLLLP